MPRSCKCILDRVVFKGAMSEEDRDKILRNLKMKWIPVTERLPEEIGDYLVTKIDDENEKVIGLCYFSFWGWTTNKEVTAWMPLPEPYKEGAKEEKKQPCGKCIHFNRCWKEREFMHIEADKDGKCPRYKEGADNGKE